MGFFSNLFGNSQNSEKEKEVISLCVQELQPELEEAKEEFKDSKGFEKALMGADVVGYIEGFFIGISTSKELGSDSYDLVIDVFIALTDEKAGNRMYQKLRALHEGNDVEEAERNTALRYSDRGQHRGLESIMHDSTSHAGDELLRLAKDLHKQRSELSMLLKKKQE